MIMTRRSPSRLSISSRVVLTVAALALLAVFPTTTVAENGSADPRYSGQPMNLEAKDTPLVQVLMQVAEIAELNFIVQPESDISVPVTASFEQIPWDQVLATVIEDSGLGYSAEGNVVWIFPKDTARATADSFAGEPISVSFDKADLRQSLQKFSEIANLDIELEPGIEGYLTLELKDVPWDQALDAVLRLNHLESAIEGNVLKVHSAK